jgi:hypothetical protein
LGWSVGGGVPGMRRVEEMAMERVACGKAIPHVFAQKKPFVENWYFYPLFSGSLNPQNLRYVSNMPDHKCFIGILLISKTKV